MNAFYQIAAILEEEEYNYIYPSEIIACTELSPKEVETVIETLLILNWVTKKRLNSITWNSENEHSEANKTRIRQERINKGYFNK